LNGNNYYLLTALPMLGELGDQPPIDGAGLLRELEPDDASYRLAETLLLGDDLLQRDAVLAGEIDEPVPAVLSAEQIRDELPLPPVLQAARQGNGLSARRIPGDALWEAYFHYAAQVAADAHSSFLADWVTWEVGLRNALVEARARELGLEPADYYVAPDLSDPIADYDAIARQWAQAPNPLAGQRLLDAARWAWLETNDRYFSFSDDELAAYAARLLLAVRWYRLQQEIDKE
jgi:hypothetical protein